MASAFDVLEGLVSAVDPNIRPVFEQIGRMVKFVSDTLEEHSKLNVNDFSAIQNGLEALSRRTAATERLIAGQAEKMDAAAGSF